MSTKLCGATLIALSLIAAPVAPGNAVQAQKKPINVLFLGHTSTHHNSGKYAPMLKEELAPDGIEIGNTTELTNLNAANLPKSHAWMFSPNHTKIEPDQEKPLLVFVAGGKGFLP